MLLYEVKYKYFITEEVCHAIADAHLAARMRGILELKKKSRKINRTKEQKFTGKVKNSLCSVWQFRGKIQIKTVEGYFTVK